MSEHCPDCRFYFVGDCRRYPPVRGQFREVYNDKRTWEHEVVYPRVTENDWCGEFQARRA